MAPLPHSGREWQKNGAPFSLCIPPSPQEQQGIIFSLHKASGGSGSVRRPITYPGSWPVFAWVNGLAHCALLLLVDTRTVPPAGVVLAGPPKHDLGVDVQLRCMRQFTPLRATVSGPLWALHQLHLGYIFCLFFTTIRTRNLNF